MRKLNAILAAAVLLLFMVHALLGSLNLMNIAPIITHTLSYTMLGLIAVHAALSTALTVKSIMTAKKTGAPYFKENRLFWARRISGYAIMVLIFFHITAFGRTVDDAYRLTEFNVLRLVCQILLVLSVAVHVIGNVKPMLISFGIKKLKPRTGDILFFVTALMAFSIAAFIVYYIRWNFI